jgi:hypothetical protein
VDLRNLLAAAAVLGVVRIGAMIVIAVLRQWWFVVCSSDQSETEAEIKCAVIIEEPLVGRRRSLLRRRRVGVLIIWIEWLKCIVAVFVDCSSTKPSDSVREVVMCAGRMIDRVATRPCYTALK